MKAIVICALLLAACTPATTRPSFAPVPEDCFGFHPEIELPAESGHAFAQKFQCPEAEPCLRYGPLRGVQNGLCRDFGGKGAGKTRRAQNRTQRLGHIRGRDTDLFPDKRLGDHPDRDRLSVRESVAALQLEGVSDRVPEVQDLAEIRLPLVLLDDRGAGWFDGSPIAGVPWPKPSVF